MTAQRAGTVAAVALVLLSGCLPYSCRREESTALMPADSVSREIAAAAATDTLKLSWSRSAAGDRELRHPRTVRFGAAGRRLYVSDAEEDAVFVFDTAGTFLDEMPAIDVPYLAGVRDDTVAVFEPSQLSMHLLVEGSPVDTLTISDPERPGTALVYGAFGAAVYYKRVAEDEESFVAEVRRDGSLGARVRLPGPHWRHAGLLRFWGDSLISLSGYRPVVDVLAPGERIDTLALRGFDSPMLARSRSFLVDEVDEPPLLSASAAASGGLLFVLNMRAGWLHVDVFDRSGALVRRLTDGGRAYRKAFFPQDIDVRLRADGTYAVAVVFTEPEAEVRLYTWQPQ